jgi:hypothetical protein
VNVTVQLAVIPNSHVPLNIRQCPNGAVLTDDGILSDCYPVTRREGRPNCASGIDDGMAPDKRIGANDRRGIYVVSIVVIRRQRLSHNTVITNNRIVTDLNVVVDDRVIPNLHVSAKLGFRTNVNVSRVEFHRYW